MKVQSIQIDTIINSVFKLIKSDSVTLSAYDISMYHKFCFVTAFIVKHYENDEIEVLQSCKWTSAWSTEQFKYTMNWYMQWWLVYMLHA